MNHSPFRIPGTLHVPSEFQGIDPMEEVIIFERRLPHWRQPGATYFTTFRLEDSIPRELQDEWNQESELWMRRLDLARHTNGGTLPREVRAEFADHQKRHMIRMEHVMDAGEGACWMSDPKARAGACEALHFFESIRYTLYAFVIMPNHVHALVRPLANHRLETILGSWKRNSAKAINRYLSRTGQVWQHESWDRIVRNHEHFRNVVRYIANNPVKAGLTPQSATVWLAPCLEAPPVGNVVQEDPAGYSLDPW